MKTRLIIPAFIACISPCFAFAQATEEYLVPRTEFGHPDFQGNWSARSLTPLQRPDAFSSLTTTAEAAEKYIDEFREAVAGGGLEDPDFVVQNVSNLDIINGELRTSVIIIPEDGKIPFSENGRQAAAADFDRFLNQYDHPEQRPLTERCMEGMSYPPMRPFIADIPRKIVQNENYFLIYSEDPGGARIIPLRSEPHSSMAASLAGNSFAYWEEETLVVETGNFRGDYPGRLNFGVSVLISEQTSVLERFSRISEDRLLYEFTLTDPSFYTESWGGEFTLQLNPHKVYEYGCHEGNYSMPGILLGGRMEQDRLAAESGAAQ